MKKGARWGEPTAETVQRRDARPVIGRCAVCDWVFEGTLGEERVASLEHRRTEHPKLISKKEKRKARRSY